MRALPLSRHSGTARSAGPGIQKQMQNPLQDFGLAPSARPGMTAWLALVLLAIGLITPASAQSDFPNRPVKIVVPFPAGGPTDVNMRIVGQKISEILGQGVVSRTVPAPTPASARSRWRNRRPTATRCSPPWTRPW